MLNIFKALADTAATGTVQDRDNKAKQTNHKQGSRLKAATVEV